jgi:hypothetical protein
MDLHPKRTLVNSTSASARAGDLVEARVETLIYSMGHDEGYDPAGLHEKYPKEIC